MSRSSTALAYDAWLEVVPEALAPVLEPFAAGRAVLVDLYGVRPPEETVEPLTLTIRPTASALCSFGLRMRPREANVLERVPGDAIRLAPTRDVAHGPTPDRVQRLEAAYGHAHVDRRLLWGLLTEKLVRRFRRNG